MFSERRTARVVWVLQVAVKVGRADSRRTPRPYPLLGQQSRFIADAAHELRSPLTALSLQEGITRASWPRVIALSSKSPTPAQAFPSQSASRLGGTVSLHEPQRGAGLVFR
jgi:signal transduction histidine kinase